MLRQIVEAVKGDERKSQKLSHLLLQAEKLLNAADLISAPNRFVDDPSTYEARHRQILSLLEQLQRVE